MEIQIILISDDHDYSYGVLSEITKLRHAVSVTEFDWNSADPRARHEISGEDSHETPAIVMLDCGYKARAFETIVDCAIAAKPRRPIECLVMRPPVDKAVYATLAEKGVLMFDSAPLPISPAVAIH